MRIDSKQTEPMRESEIKALIEFLLPSAQSRQSNNGTLMALNLAREPVLRLALAWIHETAMRLNLQEKAEFWRLRKRFRLQDRELAAWVAIVKQRMGWKDE